MKEFRVFVHIVDELIFRRKHVFQISNLKGKDGVRRGNETGWSDSKALKFRSLKVDIEIGVIDNICKCC